MQRYKVDFGAVGKQDDEYGHDEIVVTCEDGKRPAEAKVQVYDSYGNTADADVLGVWRPTVPGMPSSWRDDCDLTSTGQADDYKDRLAVQLWIDYNTFKFGSKVDLDLDDEDYKRLCVVAVEQYDGDLNEALCDIARKEAEKVIEQDVTYQSSKEFAKSLAKTRVFEPTSHKCDCHYPADC